jgi:hypothetical protein
MWPQILAILEELMGTGDFYGVLSQETSTAIESLAGC